MWTACVELILSTFLYDKNGMNHKCQTYTSIKIKAFGVQRYTLVKINIDNSKKHLHNACIFVFNTKIKLLAVTNKAICIGWPYVEVCQHQRIYHL